MRLSSKSVLDLIKMPSYQKDIILLSSRQLGYLKKTRSFAPCYYKHLAMMEGVTLNHCSIH